MRVVRSLVLLLTLLAIPALTSAQRPPDPRGPDDVRPDTTRFFPRWMMATAQAGVGWMAAPERIGSRYMPGVDVGLSLAAQPARRMRVGISLEYHDLPADPNGYAGYFDSTGVYPMLPVDFYGDGHLLDAIATLSVRPRGALWLEGGIGWGRFESGWADVSFFDGATGNAIRPPGTSGWGAVVSAEARYEFQPNPRDRLYVSAGWRSMERDGQRMHFVPIHVGYRFD